MIPPIEQARLKRVVTGLRVCDPKRTAGEYTLFTSLGGNTVYLIDSQGRLSHTWEMPYPAGHAYLTERGMLIYNGNIATTDGGFLSRSPWKGGTVLGVEWNGTVLWEVRHPDHHHDAQRLRNGNVLLLCLARVPDDLAARVRGGRSGSEDNGAMYADYLVEMTTAGQVVWKWRSWEHLDPCDDVIANAEDAWSEWTHGTAIAELPDGNIVITFFNISTVVVVNRRSGAITWKMGPSMFAGPHAATPLPNGNLLIVDNETHRLDDSLAHSRVLEIDPRANTVVWQYRYRPAVRLCSPDVSNAQRLWNGNTLINDGVSGRLFEVTADGDMVWGYVNAFFGGPPDAQTNLFVRAHRYRVGEIARARSSGQTARGY